MNLERENGIGTLVSLGEGGNRTVVNLVVEGENRTVVNLVGEGRNRTVMNLVGEGGNRTIIVSWRGGGNNGSVLWEGWVGTKQYCILGGGG